MGERSRGRRALSLLVTMLLCAGAGWLVGSLIGGGLGATRVPHGYLVPVVPGGTALRLAMVHDVLTERYPRHSDAWHEARIGKRRAEVERHRVEGTLGTPAAMAVGADLAVSLDLLQRSREAEPILREQLGLLPEPAVADPALIELLFDDHSGMPLLAQPLAETDRPAYAAYANLATVLAHANARAAVAGDGSALPALREAREWVLRALTINPGAHFGRELWQLCALDWLISVAEHPDRVISHDLLGRRWETAIRRAAGGPVPGSWRDIPRLANGDLDLEEEALLDPTQRRLARSGIRRVEIGEAQSRIEQRACAFDRPVLGMLGMWMHGGGPSPHLALALAHVLESVGQRWLAWEAYARALTMSERFPERGRAAFVAHCHERQRGLTAALAPADAPGLQQRLETGFAADLAEGIAWRDRWQAEERARLAAGADVDDPALARALLAAHPVPSTPPGEADYRLLEPAEAGTLGFVGMLAGPILACLVIPLGRFLAGLRDRARRARAVPPPGSR